MTDNTDITVIPVLPEWRFQFVLQEALKAIARTEADGYTSDGHERAVDEAVAALAAHAAMRTSNERNAAPPTPAPDAHGPYVPCFIGSGTWAGIIEALPADLVGKSVWVTTAPPAAGAAPAPRLARKPDWLLVARAAGKHGIRYPTNSALEQFLSDIGSLPAPVSANTLDESYNRGRLDILNALLAPNKVLGEQLAELHGREPEPEGRTPFDVRLWVNGVAEQIGIKTLEEMTRVSESEESGEAEDAT